MRNLAPFSFFNAFGAAPVILGFAPMATREAAVKDTLANIRATGEFVINIATEAMLPALDATGERFAPHVDEFIEAGLGAAPSLVVAPPRVAEAPVSFECRLFSLVPLGTGDGSATLVLGEAVHLHVADAIMRDGAIDPILLRPVARMGGAAYARPALLPFERKHRGS